MARVDGHFHVIAPAGSSPMFPGRSYTPQPASLDAWRATLGPLGYQICLVAAFTLIASLIDLKAEISRLEKEIARLKGEIAPLSYRVIRLGQ